ncbi:MAG: enoyl-CoA hydratase [Novosphingobium meiothermophilum]|uniref:enoyl-CoA hydratase n=1 Tax=Novosphingobium TaxID=165696 RepID=UPI000D6E7493|nr:MULTISPECIES: enoyl-CoA hydratase [Novosphingobium]
MTDLIVRTNDGRGRTDIVLNRPDKFNALSEAMLAALLSELEALAADPALRVVVLSGAGKAFCAGHDLAEMQANRSLDHFRKLFAACTEVMEAIVALPVPVIAKVHGVATAAGCQLVGACDLAVAAESARFAVSGINVGLFCSTPAVALSRNVPTKRAFEMLVTGRFVDACVAAEWGLINTITPSETLDDAVNDLAQTIISKNPDAIRRGKALFYAQREVPRAEAYRLACEVMARNMMDENTNEGIEAFLAKREPVWR